MKDLNVNKTLKLLSRIMEFELAGVVRYTHYSLMVAGPNRIPIVQFMKGQATESLLHASQAGEILTGLGGHPTLQIAPIDETYRHSVKDILEESLLHEQRALKIYKELLDVVEDRSVYLEEFARTQIAQEEVHGLELRKMLRDITVMARGDDHAHQDHGHHDDHDDAPLDKTAPKKVKDKVKVKVKDGKNESKKKAKKAKG
jgi:bacterioferritin